MSYPWLSPEINKSTQGHTGDLPQTSQGAMKLHFQEILSTPWEHAATWPVRHFHWPKHQLMTLDV